MKPERAALKPKGGDGMEIDGGSLDVQGLETGDIAVTVRYRNSPYRRHEAVVTFGLGPRQVLEFVGLVLRAMAAANGGRAAWSAISTTWQDALRALGGSSAFSE